MIKSISPSYKHSKKSSAGELSVKSNRYLEELKEIQLKAKKVFRQNSLLENFPGPPPLERHNIHQVNATVDHMRVPILVPQSFIRKNNKMKPPMMNCITKTGEIMSVHLLSDSVPIYDPLVKAEAQFAKSSLGKPEVLADIRYNGNQGNRLLKSVSPYKNKVAAFELTPPEGLHVIREHTPRDRVERYNFRDSDMSENTGESSRTWVAQRMKSYSRQIKDSFKPQVSSKKQLEMEILKEKMKKDKPVGNKRIKLLQISRDSGVF